MEIIAHRGASHAAPENTLAAARLAWAEGADALEGDVHLTRDGELVVVHDDDAQRVAGSALRIADASVAELKSLDVGGWKHARFAGERVPLLAELLGTVPGRRRIFIELKTDASAVPALVRCLAHAALAPAQVAIISFQLEAARAAKRLLPRCEACWVREREPDRAAPAIDEIVAHARDAGLDGLDLDVAWPVDAGLVRRVHAAGLKLYAWTVDDAPTARRLAAAGVDGITTNRPGWLREQLQLRA